MLLFKWRPSQKISKKSAEKSCTVCGGEEGGVFLGRPSCFSTLWTCGSILDPDWTRSVDSDPRRQRKCYQKKEKN